MSRYLSKSKRPFHTTDVSRDITPDQIEALNHLFERFLFFRLARTITINSKNETDYGNIDITTQVLFDRIFVIFEDSDRTGARVMNGLSNKSLDDGYSKTRIELGLMPKKALSPALELADL